MALTLDELIAARDQLHRARAKGVSEVEYQDQRVRYRSDAEMLAAIQDLDRRIASFARPPVKVVVFAPTKGI